MSSKNDYCLKSECMKKLVILMVIVMFGIVLFNSCKTADCPAYSQASPTEVEQPA
jgi:hypothetical protein